MHNKFTLPLIVLMLSIFSLPMAAHAATPSTPNIQTVTSHAGSQAWLIEEKTVPIFSLRIAFENVGSAYDPAGKSGLAELASRLLNEGAGELDQKAFQNMLDAHAISLGFSCGKEQCVVSLDSLSEHKDKAFELLGLALTKPRIDEDAFIRNQEQMLAELKILAQNPNYKAARAYAKHAFGDHPYGRSQRGGATSIHALSQSDIRQFIRGAFTHANAKIAVVGDISSPELSSLLSKYLDTLPTAFSAATLANAPLQNTGESIAVEQAGEQMIIQFGWSALKRDDPDFYNAYILNYLLGGSGLTSRLSQVIRQEHGLSYSVNTGLATYNQGGFVQGSFATRNAKAEMAVDLLTKTVRTIAQDGFAEEELTKAQQYITGSFPLRLASNGSLVQYLLTMQTQNLGQDYLAKRNGYMQSVTLEDINRLAHAWLAPEKMLLVTAGPKNR